jgi:hypothetical protein
MLRRLPLLLACITFGACDTQNQQNEFSEEAARPPAGYTSTDASGRILQDDTNDWRTSPVYIGKVRVDPAYPNPVSTEFVTIPFTVLDFDAVRGGLVLRAFNTSNNFVLLDEERNATQPGAFIFSFSPGLLGAPGLFRLYVFDAFGEIVSYGDLLIQ